ncbi:hypothetical protein ACFWRZ_08885 [Streptomyces rubiginosohelvolus]|uniref:hypothetical protein n=1 Tax=Streptomyces rubiginosohelvolus TaxID=67362 RepID=UPI00364D63A3
MSDAAPQRVPQTTPTASAALLLGCSPNQVGPCARACGGLTIRYGAHANPVCPACQHEKPLAPAVRRRG